MAESVMVDVSELESTDDVQLNRDLVVDIAAHGLVNQRTKKIVDGLRRLKACRHLGMKTISVFYC